jgi:hypothetical protein
LVEEATAACSGAGAGAGAAEKAAGAAQAWASEAFAPLAAAQGGCGSPTTNDHKTGNKAIDTPARLHARQTRGGRREADMAGATVNATHTHRAAQPFLTQTTNACGAPRWCCACKRAGAT